MIDERNLDLAYNKLKEYNNKIENQYLREVGNRILTDYKEDFYTVPGGSTKIIDGEEILSHHSYKGGILIHSLGVCNTAYTIAKTYESKVIDMDLVIFCGMFHDLGKVKCYSKWDENKFPHTYKFMEDEMMGHVYYSCNIVQKYLNEYEELSDDYKLKILHIIGSHHYSRATGSMAERKMIEAIIVSKADNIDALLTPSIKALEDLKEGEVKTDKIYMLKDYIISSKTNERLLDENE